MNTVAGLPPGALDFALPHAVNLAEAGSSIDERKTGQAYRHFLVEAIPEASLRIPVLL